VGRRAGDFRCSRGKCRKTPDFGPLRDAIGVPKYLFCKDRKDEFR